MGNTVNNNQFVCVNVLTSQANGDDNVYGDSVLDEIFGPSSLIQDIP
jgi:hypothetical protein